jgi:hypothetical protein
MSSLNAPRLNTIPDLRREFFLFDDFIGVTTDKIGDANWSDRQGPSGQITLTPDAVYDSSSLGIVTLAAGTTVNGYCSIYLGDNSVGVGFAAGGPIVNEVRVKLPRLRDAGEDYTIYVGLADEVESELAPTRGIYFSYSAASGFWRAHTAVGGVTTTVTSSVTVAAGTWYKLRAETNAAGTLVTFSVNGTVIGTSATNIPNTSASGLLPSNKIVKVAGTVEDDELLIDYYSLNKTFNPVR